MILVDDQIKKKQTNKKQKSKYTITNKNYLQTEHYTMALVALSWQPPAEVGLLMYLDMLLNYS